MNGRVGSVVVLLVGYLLGRTRKLKLVLRMASAIGGRRLLNNRRNVMGRLAKVLDSSPEGKRFVNNVTGLRTPHEAVRKASETIGRAPRPAGEDRAVERERRPGPSLLPVPVGKDRGAPPAGRRAPSGLRAPIQRFRVPAAVSGVFPNLARRGPGTRGRNQCQSKAARRRSWTKRGARVP